MGPSLENSGRFKVLGRYCAVWSGLTNLCLRSLMCGGDAHTADERRPVLGRAPDLQAKPAHGRDQHASEIEKARLSQKSLALASVMTP